ncbi:MAG: histidine kinase, partial [Prevotellaceae bacterium]|nr:histidine kinase [Prevotellaceae bacterium]
MATTISLLINFIFIISFLYVKANVNPPEGMMKPPANFHLIKIIFQIVRNFILVYLLYMLNAYLLRIQVKKHLKVIILIVTTLIATMLLSNIFSGIQIVAMSPFDYTRMLRGELLRDLFIAVIVVFSAQMINMSNKQRQTLLENEKLKAENIRTRYEILKNQVDPHFLFNSLNTLNTLIKMDANKAQDYVQQLAYVFRYTLQNKEIITLEEELKVTYAYCNLMKIRYGDGLYFDFNIDKKFLKYNIMPLSLQTLTENAIKHNVISTKQPFVVCFNTNGEDAVTVSNPVQPKKEKEVGDGIGLANLAERYRLMQQRSIYLEQSKRYVRV